jgi:O-antigen/teichoic acid export membrane protein
MGTPAALPQSDSSAGAARSDWRAAIVPSWPRVRSLTQRAIDAPLVRRFAYGAVWNTLATAASRVLMLLAMIYAARVLGRELTGRLGAVQNTMGMFGVFAGCGLGIAATKFVAEFRRTDPARAGRIIAWTQMSAALLGGLFAFGCMVLSPWLSAHVLAEPRLALPLQSAAALVFCNTLQGVQTGALIGFEAFRAVAVVNAIGGLCTIALVTIGTSYAGLDGAVLGLVLTAAIQAIVGQIAIRTVARSEATPLVFHAAWKETGMLVRFSLPVAAAALTVIPTEWAVTAMLTNQPGGYAELGLYSAAGQWFNALLLMPMIVGQAVLPMLSERWSHGDRRGFVRLLFLAMASNAAVVFPLVVAGWFGSGWLMTQMGAEFADGTGVLCILLTTTLVMALVAPVGNSLQASGRSGISLMLNLAWAVTYFTLAWWFVSSGAEGIAWARLLAYCAHLVWVSAYVVVFLWSKPGTKPGLPESRDSSVGAAIRAALDRDVTCPSGPARIAGPTLEAGPSESPGLQRLPIARSA